MQPKAEVRPIGDKTEIDTEHIIEGFPEPGYKLKATIRENTIGKATNPNKMYGKVAPWTCRNGKR